MAAGVGSWEFTPSNERTKQEEDKTINIKSPSPVTSRSCIKVPSLNSFTTPHNSATNRGPSVPSLWRTFLFKPTLGIWALKAIQLLSDSLSLFHGLQIHIVLMVPSISLTDRQKSGTLNLRNRFLSWICQFPHLWMNHSKALTWSG